MKLSSVLYHINLRLRKWDSQRLVRSLYLIIHMYQLAPCPDPDYKTCQNITSLVAKWGKTLHTTLKKYNTLAVSMNPPKPKLAWVNITSLDFISNIVILHGCEDIRDKPCSITILEMKSKLV